MSSSTTHKSGSNRRRRAIKPETSLEAGDRLAGRLPRIVAVGLQDPLEQARAGAPLGENEDDRTGGGIAFGEDRAEPALALGLGDQPADERPSWRAAPSSAGRT